jgi:hypothetical protein
MRRFAFSIAILGVISATLCGTTQATPIAPVPPAVASVTPVYYRHWHRHYRHHGRYPIAGYWNYYRTFGPGRGNSVESTR